MRDGEDTHSFVVDHENHGVWESRGEGTAVPRRNLRKAQRARGDIDSQTLDLVDEVGAEVGACILVVASDRRELLERFDAEARSPSASHFRFC
jgi:hypothetical protein